MTDKMVTLNQMLEVSQVLDAGKYDYEEIAKERLHFDEQASLVVPPLTTLFGYMDQATFPLTEHAISQLCTKLKVPKSYMDRCPPSLQATNYNHWLGDPSSQREWFIRVYNDQVRALLSKDYVPIFNSQVLDAMIQIVGDVPYSLQRPHIDSDTLIARILVETSHLSNIGPEGGYGVGVAFGNGETGNSAVWAAGFIQRHSCENSTVFGEERMYIKHIHHTSAFIFGSLKEYAGNALRIAKRKLDLIVQADMDTIPDFSAVVNHLAREEGWSENVRDLVLVGAEHQSTRLGVSDGLAYAARHGGEYVSPEDALALELFSGAVLTNNNNRYTREFARVRRS